MGKRTSSLSIETSTTWDDAGYDCDHCGGRILRRTDRETGLRDRTCYQCEQCSCQWTLARQPLRVGTTSACRAAQRQRAAEAEEGGLPTSRWLLAALMMTNVNVQSLTVEAALTGRREHSYHAAMLDPHTAAELDPEQIFALVDDLIAAHGDWLPHYERGERAVARRAAGHNGQANV